MAHFGVPLLGRFSPGMVIHDDELGEAAAFLARRDLVRIQFRGHSLEPVAGIQLPYA